MRLRRLLVAVPLVALTLASGCVPVDDGLPLPGTVVSKWAGHCLKGAGCRSYMRTKSGQGTSEGEVPPLAASRCRIGDRYPACAKKR